MNSTGEIFLSTVKEAETTSSDVENCTVQISTGQDEHPTQNTSKEIPNWILQYCINVLNFLRPRTTLVNLGNSFSKICSSLQTQGLIAALQQNCQQWYNLCGDTTSLTAAQGSHKRLHRVSQNVALQLQVQLLIANYQVFSLGTVFQKTSSQNRKRYFDHCNPQFINHSLHAAVFGPQNLYTAGQTGS